MKNHLFTFVNTLLSAFFVSFLFYACGSSEPKITLATPTALQQKFMDQEIGAFFHFSINTFTGDEHGDGGRPASAFNPQKLDIDQWMEAAKNIGAKYAILTARHEDGFCLWPTTTTEYCVRNSPWKNGQGNVVREFVDACRRHDILPGLYFSPNYNGNEIFREKDRPVSWGRHWDSLTRVSFSDTAFCTRYRQLEIDQITELMTQYGPIYYLWMDHWNAAKDQQNDVCRTVTDLVRKLQPECLLSGPDIRHPGTEKGIVIYPLWNAVNTVDSTMYTRPVKNVLDKSVVNNYGLLETDVIMGHPEGQFWRNVECPTDAPFSHGGWFWHHELQRLSLEKLMDYYYRTVGLGANIVINLPPDREGLIPAETVEATRAFGQEFERRFGHITHETTEAIQGIEAELRWETPEPINHVMLMEDLSQGQRIIAYSLEAWVDGAWQPLKPANRFMDTPEGFVSEAGFETVGHKKIDRVEPVVTDRIRWRCLRSVTPNVGLLKMAAWNVEE